MMRDVAAQSDPKLSPNFRRRWSDRQAKKPTRQAIDAALAMFAPHRRTSDQPCADLQKVSRYEAADR